MKKYFRMTVSVLLCLSMCLGFFACTEPQAPVSDTTEAEQINTAEETTAREEITEMEEIKEKISLDGKRVIFIGNSYVYHGRTVMNVSSSVMTQAERECDRGIFYQLCKANGMDVNVTNWTFGGHGLADFFGAPCAHASSACRGTRHEYELKNRYYEVYLAGGQLIGPEENSNFPEVTAEQLFSWDPDIILVDNHGGLPGLVMESMYREGGKWSTLSAVQNQQLHRIPAGVFFLDKGSTTTLLVLWMATILQPELFADIDMVEEVKYYYSEFYEFDLTDEQAQNVINGWVIDDE